MEDAQEVPVLVLDVDQAEADVILATLDPLSSMATADPDFLAALLEDVVLPDELGDVLKALLPDGPREGKVDPDWLPKQITPVTEPGDTWILGRHRLRCGDAREVKALLDGDQANMVWTDPPYDVGYQGGTGDHLTIENDRLAYGAYGELIEEAFDAAYEVTRPGGPIYICHPDGGPASKAFRSAIDRTRWDFKQVIVWVKSSLVLSRQDYHWQHEPILYGWKPGAAHAWYGGYSPATVIDEDLEPEKMSKAQLVEIVTQLRETTTVMREDKPHRNADHPTIKPVGLVERALGNSSRRGDVILDPFAGSGTTIIAAERLGRTAAAVDLDPAYCDIAVRRWEAFTGETAERTH